MMLSDLKAKIDQFLETKGDFELGEFYHFKVGFSHGYEYGFQPYGVSLDLQEGEVKGPDCTVKLDRKFVDLSFTPSGESVMLRNTHDEE